MKELRTEKIIAGLVLLILMVGSANAQGSLFVEFYFGESFSWEISNISVNTNLWYNVSTFTFVAKWHANKSDIMTFSVSNAREIHNELYLFGNLSLGNLSLQTNNKDIGFNLGLSANPWYGGLIALVSDWDALLNTLPFNTTNANVDKEKRITILNQAVEVIEINYEDGFQKTTLQYEKQTGILMYANTTVGNFWLEFHLIESTIPIPSPTNSIAINEGLVLGALVIMAHISKKSKKKKRKAV